MNFIKKKIPEFQEHLSLAIKLILVLSIISAIYYQLWHIMSTNIFLLILLLLPQIIKKSYKLKIPIEFEWILLIFVISTFFLESIGRVIAPIFFGIAVGLIGFMILLILYSNNQIKKNYFLIILFSFNFAIAFGFALELLKYYLKLMLGHEMSVGIFAHTMKDMTYVLIGAAISSIFGFIYMKSHKGLMKKIVDKFKIINPKLFSKTDSPKEMLELIRKGEDEKTEFKSTLRVNLHTNEIDRKIEYATLKTIAAFLNSNGGTLLLGVSDKGEISGIEKDRFESNDKFSLHFTNIIKEKIGKKYLHLINIQSILAEEKTVLKINCQKSDKEVFLKPTPNEEEFYIRAGPSSIQIKGSELIDYIERRFKEKK